MQESQSSPTSQWMKEEKVNVAKSHPIRKYMTRAVRTIREDIPLSKALVLMREHRIRHLPVEQSGRLVGLVSDRDIKLALTVHPAAKDLKAADIMTENPYSVREDCPLEEVLREMAKRKLGCTIVTNDNGQPIGLFTAVDALGLFGEWLRKKKVGEETAEPTVRIIL